MHDNPIINGIDLIWQLPGLKSVAMETCTPLSINLRAGAYVFLPKKKGSFLPFRIKI